MPYARKTLTQLRDDVLQDIASAQITNSSGIVLGSLLAKAILRVLAYAQAGMAYEHYGFLDWISLQAVPWTATGEFLEAWAALRGVIREPAIATTGTATFSGENGTDCPPGTSLVRSDGFAFTTVADAVVSGGAVTVTMAAAQPGALGNFDANVTFILANPITGINAQSTASTQVTPGADPETDDSLRSRMLAVYAAPPQGGDRQDYIEWATAVPGVTRAWIAPNAAGAGTVTVYFMMDVAEAAHGGFPQGTNGVAAAEPRDAAATGDQLFVANAIFAEQPVTALVYLNAPAAQPVNFTVSDLGANNTTAMQGQITAALIDMFVRLGQAGGTVDPTTGAAWPGIEPSAWYDALEAIPGLTAFKVTTPSALITPSAGNLLTVGTITFNT